MKQIIIIIVLLFITQAGICPQNKNTIILLRHEGIDPHKSIFNAIVAVESSGDSLAYNKDEKAVGIVQIRQIKLTDYYMRTGKRYKLQDCYSIKVSKEIFYYYVGRYEPDNLSAICKEWNGRGPKHKDYIKKVKKQLEILVLTN